MKKRDDLPEPGTWAVEGSTVYMLSTQLVNAFTAQVQPGYGNDGKRLSQADCEIIARRMAAVDDVISALKQCAAVCAGETTHKGGLVNALTAARAALAKATGDTNGK